MLHVLHTRMLSLRTLRVADSTILGYPSVIWNILDFTGAAI